MSRCVISSSARAGSINARRSMLVGLGEVVRIGRWIELRSDPLCLGQKLNHERHLRAAQVA